MMDGKHGGGMMAVLSIGLWACALAGETDLTHSGHSREFIDSLVPGQRAITIPTIDFSENSERHVIVAQGTPALRHGHASTVLMSDALSMFVVWTEGHGGPVRFLKKSTDGGVTWSDHLDVPHNWAAHSNSPPLYRLPVPQGRRERLYVFAQNGPQGMRMYRAFSEDGGESWGGFEPAPLSDGDGLLHADVMPFTAVEPVDVNTALVGVTNIRRPGEGFPTNVIAQSRSSDGGLSWSDWEIVLDLGDPFRPSEPELIRSPDGSQLLMIIRENERSFNSWLMLSDNEGETWSDPWQAPASVSMDRHQHRYAPDGRLVITGRDTADESPTRRHFVAWVGTYEDLVEGREGEYRVKLLPHHGSGNVEYPSLELLADGTFVATNSVVYRPGENYSVVNTRFTLAELDAQVEAAARPVLRMERALEIIIPTERGRYYEIQKQTGNPDNQFWEHFRAFEGTGHEERVLFSSRDVSADDVRVLRTSLSVDNLPVLYATDFEGPDQETPKGWNLRAGSTAHGSLHQNQYRFDYRFGSPNMTFLAVLETQGAHEWTDYLIVTTASSQRVQTPVFDYNDTIGLVARVSLGETTNLYHPRLWPRVNWPADWLETGERGGRLEIFRLGGPGNASLSLLPGVLDPDPEPDLNTGGNPVPAPAQRTVTMHFAVMGEHLIHSLWDEAGNFIGQTSATDSNITQGAPGIRVPALRDSIVSFDNFRVYDLAPAQFVEVAPFVERRLAAELAFDAPIDIPFRIEQSSDMHFWNEIEGEIARSNNEVRVLLSLPDTGRQFFRMTFLQ